MGDLPPPVAQLKRRELIILKDAGGHLIDYEEKEPIRRMRRRLIEINEATASVTIELPPGIGEPRGDLLLIGNSCVNRSKITLYRVFNEDFSHGGRLYGHWTQGLKKTIRELLTINGESVAEPDYKAHFVFFTN